MIAVIAYNKGGAGKTNLATNTAGLLAQEGPTLLIDTDDEDEGTSASWAHWRRKRDVQVSPTTIRLRGDAVRDEGRSLIPSFKHTIIDVGGSDNMGLRAALLIADVVVIPMAVSRADSSRMGRMVDIVAEAKTINEKLVPLAVINKVDTRARDSNDIRKALKKYEKLVSVMDVVVYERKSFRVAYSMGLTVAEAREDDRAIAETKRFVRELQSAAGES